MTKKASDQKHSGSPAQPIPADNVNRVKQKSEEKKVEGLHQNTGQKDHKGAR